jgi:two-component system nitrate/nitrite sensor histidine kinase NarX
MEKNILLVRWVTFAALVVTAFVVLLPIVTWSAVNSMRMGILIVFTAAMLTWAVETWLRYLVSRLGEISRPSSSSEFAKDEHHADLLLKANRELWLSKTEKEIVEAVMKTGIELLDAAGASFTGFGEWKPLFPPLTMGDVPTSKDGDWSNRLTHASTRQACRKCALRESNSGCVLGEDVLDEVLKVICLPIMDGKREIGLVNYFFRDLVRISEVKREALQQLSETAELAVNNLRLKAQGSAVYSYLESSQSRQTLSSLLLNLCSVVAKKFNFLSVAVWSPNLRKLSGNPGLLAFVDERAGESSKVIEMAPYADLWQQVLTGEQLEICEVKIDHNEKNKVLLVPLGETGENPVGMMVVRHELSKNDLERLFPALQVVAQALYAILFLAEMTDRLEYRAVKNERFRLAREIHDGIAQTLAYLKIQAAQMLGYFNTGKLDNLESALSASYQTLSEAYNDARREIEDLRNVAEVDTQEWVVNLAMRFRDDTGIAVDISNLQLDARIPLSVQSQLIRIVQEALNNIRQHAQAEKVTISGHVKQEEAVLEISDDGIGFEPEYVETGPRYGLIGMRERADMIGGEFQIISMKDRGTKVRVTFPLEKMT